MTPRRSSERLIIDNLKDDALRFYERQSEDVKGDFDQLTTSLREWSEDRRDPNRTEEAMERLHSLAQGSKTMEEYLSEARWIKDALKDKEIESSVIKRMMRGVRDDQMR